MKYQIGLIGCGGIAGTWIQAVAQHPDCRIALTYDIADEAARQRATEVGGQAVPSVEALLAGAIDLVIIGTPTPSHPDLVMEAARAGKHILCEKPMALNLDLCRTMTQVCQEAGVKLAIGHSLRFWDAFLACRRLVGEGAIGVPVSGSIDRMGTAATAHRRDDESQPDHWRHHAVHSGGHVLEGFIHELDFARAIFGEVESVSCQIAGGRDYDGILSPQISQALVGFTGGALATLRTGATVAMPTRGYWLGGTEGGLRFSEWGGPVEHFVHGRDQPQIITPQSQSAYYLELCDLLNAIEEDGEPENSPLNGMKNIALGLGMYWSFETGQRVQYQNGLPVDMAGDYQNTQW
ncbi:MAG: hypothetical protein GKR89_04100 [Candidatus Latescibacteria bacterium]|nr:hypothetical protein [Candidatus Latescibacterota bacterium]